MQRIGFVFETTDQPHSRRPRPKPRKELRRRWMPGQAWRRLTQTAKDAMELLRLWTKFLAVAGGMIARVMGFPANHHGAVQALTMRARTWLLFSAPRHGEILSPVAASKTAHACGSILEGPTRRDLPPVWRCNSAFGLSKGTKMPLSLL